MVARKDVLCLMLASMLLVLTTMGTPIARAPSDGIPQVTINGTTFIVNGEPYMFKGVNVQFDGLHHEESGCQPISRATFDLYKSWNVNLFRVWLNMEMATSREGTWNQDFFDKLETVLDLAEEYGIYLLISGLHQYNLGPKFDGTGFPDWVFSGISTKSAAWDMFYQAVVQESPTYQNVRNGLREYVHRIAAICKDRNIVMGYDIFNEPQYRDLRGYSKISASYFYEALSEYHTETDPYKPQAVENNFIDDYYKPKIPNLFVAPHGYARHTYEYSLSQMKDYFRDSGYWVQGPNWGVPTLNAEWFLGNREEAQEYGLTATEIASWYNTYITAMKDLGIGWAFLRCEATPSALHWSGSAVKDVLLNHWASNTAPPAPPPPQEPWDFSDGFEAGSFINWNGTYTTSGETAAVVSTLAYNGTYSARFTSNGGSGYEYSYLYKAVDNDEIYVRGYFYIAQGLPLVDNDDRFTLIIFAGSSGDVICGLQVKRVQGEDRFFLYGVSGSSSSSVATQSTTEVYPQEDVWYNIALYAYTHATKGAYRVYIDGVETLSVTGIDTSRAGSIGTVRVGLATVTNVQDYVTVYCDNVVFIKTTGDLNGDGLVNIFDSVILAGAYMTTPADDNWNPAADLNRDGIVDIFDMAIFARFYSG